MKGAVFILGIIIVSLIILCLVIWAWGSRKDRRIKELEDLVNGIDEPELWLTKEQRREVALKRLAREDDEYFAKRRREEEAAIQGFLPHSKGIE